MHLPVTLASEMVAEIQIGQTAECKYLLIITRQPRSPLAMLRESKQRPLNTVGERFEQLTLSNPEGDSVAVELTQNKKSARKPFRYYNGCTKAWLILAF